MPYFTHEKDQPLTSENLYVYLRYGSDNGNDQTDAIEVDGSTAGSVFMFATAQEANAKKLSLQRARTDGLRYDVSFFATRAQTETWIAREKNKFRSGEYARVPWHSDLSSYYPRHFAHMSTKMPGKIAYTISEEHGVNNRQTVVRPGKYLQDYFGEGSDLATEVDTNDRLTKAQIDSYAAQCTALVSSEVSIAETINDAIYVYTNGPRSCMSRDADRYQGHVHPAAVYAGPHADLRIAYHGTIGGTITSRAIVWPEKKIAGRIYPDSNAALKHILHSAGYEIHADSYNGIFNGATIAAIEDDNGHGHIMPYVDGISYAYLTRDRKSFVLGDRDDRCDRDMCAVSTQMTADSGGDTLAAGVTEPHDDEPDYDFTCDRCNGEYMDDDRDSRDSDLCTSCADDVYRSCDDCSGDVDTRDDSTTRIRRRVRGVMSSIYLCESCTQEHTHECDRCNDTWIDISDDADHGSNGDLCGSCAESYARCEHSDCGDYTSTDDDTCASCDRPRDGSDSDDDDDDTEQLTLPIEPIAQTSNMPIVQTAIDTSRPWYVLQHMTEMEWEPCHMSDPNDYQHTIPAVSQSFTTIARELFRLAAMYPDHMYRIVIQSTQYPIASNGSIGINAADQLDVIGAAFTRSFAIEGAA